MFYLFLIFLMGVGLGAFRFFRPRLPVALFRSATTIFSDDINAHDVTYALIAFTAGAAFLTLSSLSEHGNVIPDSYAFNVNHILVLLGGIATGEVLRILYESTNTTEA